MAAFTKHLLKLRARAEAIRTGANTAPAWKQEIADLRAYIAEYQTLPALREKVQALQSGIDRKDITIYRLKH